MYVQFILIIINNNIIIITMAIISQKKVSCLVFVRNEIHVVQQSLTDYFVYLWRMTEN